MKNSSLHIKRLLANGQLRKVFESLLVQLDDNSEEFDEVILIQCRYHLLCGKLKTGTLTLKDEFLFLNSISRDLINVINSTE